LAIWTGTALPANRNSTPSWRTILPTNPWLQLTNVAGLGGTNVTFAPTNDLTGAFSVEFTTNFLDWLFLGPAKPRYLFTDTKTPVEPQRDYRLRWP